MEQRIKLITKTVYDLEPSELRQYYLMMALMLYRHSCKPEYNERKMLLRLRNELKRYNQEMIKLREKDSNNLTLSQIQNFMQKNYGFVRKLVKQNFD
ncbi:MAG: hypothetical protein R3Y38_07370 [Rikenellaceae bacterium]